MPACQCVAFTIAKPLATLFQSGEVGPRIFIINDFPTYKSLPLGMMTFNTTIIHNCHDTTPPARRKCPSGKGDVRWLHRFNLYSSPLTFRTGAMLLGVTQPCLRPANSIRQLFGRRQHLFSSGHQLENTPFLFDVSVDLRFLSGSADE